MSLSGGESAMKTVEADALTGLATYDVLIEYLEDSVPAEVLYIEIDEPARFNDAFGYDTDKRILLYFCENISSLLDDELFVRIGTYSFVIAKKNPSKPGELKLLAEKIINQLREPMNFEGNLLYMTAAIGIASSFYGFYSAATLVRQAEHAMKKAKREGTNRIVLCQENRGFSFEHELKLLRDIPRAIENGEIYFVYQGQYNYAQKAFTGAEMLARWEHPVLGNVPPDIFIPLAEKSGMITPLMNKTLIEVSKMYQKLEEKGFPDFSIALNLSFQVLMEESFLDNVTFLLDAYGLQGKPLTFEIMEDTIPDHLESFIARLDEVKALGFSLAVDDYGTGHTSLTYLLHFPIDYLKIDRSFVHNIHQNRRNFLLFKSMIDMADALELKVIAEGVETPEDDAVLQQFEGITVQGYLYCKPLRAEDLLKRL